MRRARIPVAHAVLIPALLAATLAACSSAGSPGASPTPDPGSGTPSPTSSPAPDQLILRVFSDGGFVPPGYIVTRLPELSIYADGRVIQPGAVPAIYPGPPVTPLMVHQLSGSELEAVRSAARTAGLDGPDRSFFDAPVADAPTTVFTYVDAAGEHRLAIYALGIGVSDSASAEERAARVGASELLVTLGKIVDVTPGETWDPTAYRVYATGVDDPAPSQDPAPNVLDWPADLPAIASLPPIEEGPILGRCGVFSDAQAVAFRSLLAQATQITLYREAGAEWTLLIRPLLPDEPRTCP